MIQWIINHFHRRRRDFDLRVLWPACCSQAKSLDQAKAAFAVHALNDSSWLRLGYDNVVQFIDEMVPIGRCPHWEDWDTCPICSH